MKKSLMMAAIGVAVVAAILAVAPAALASTSNVGKNVGDEIKSWDTALLLSIAGLLAIPVLAKRDVGGGVVLALLVVLVGGFAFAPVAVRTVIESLWRAVSG
jgi:cobalamin synthase